MYCISMWVILEGHGWQSILLVGTLKMCMKVSVNEIGGFNFGEW